MIGKDRLKLLDRKCQVNDFFGFFTLTALIAVGAELRLWLHGK
jgi:hypothetical protein